MFKSKKNLRTMVKGIIIMLVAISMFVLVPGMATPAFAERYNVGDTVRVNSDFWWVRDAKDSSEESKNFKILDNEIFTILSVEEDGWYEIMVPGKEKEYYLQIPWNCDEYFELYSAASVQSDPIITTTTTVEPENNLSPAEIMQDYSYFQEGDRVRFNGGGWKTYSLPVYSDTYVAGALEPNEVFLVKRAYAPWYYIQLEKTGEDVFTYLDNKDAESKFTKLDAITIPPTTEPVTTTTDVVTTTITSTTETTTTTTETTTSETTTLVITEETTTETNPVIETTTVITTVTDIVTTEYVIPLPESDEPEYVSGPFIYEYTEIGDVFLFTKEGYEIHNSAGFEEGNVIGHLVHGDSFVLIKNGRVYPHWYIIYNFRNKQMGYIHVPQEYEEYFTKVAKYSWEQMWYGSYEK